MIGKILKKIIGTRNDRILRKIKRIIQKINDLEPEIKKLSDSELAAKTQEFKQRLSAGATLEDILAEAFAVVREASWRTLNMRHFDVQLIGGIVLHSGKIAEMRTGEGKTLSATLAAYLNALTGKSVHVITVNDYLARRDAEWMRPIYEFLGLSVSFNLSNMRLLEKKAAYQADIIYGTNNEFGFDYLRDNMVYSLEDCVQRDLHYAIIDEVDSILIDEARTPLIISGPGESSSDLYLKINQLVPQLTLQKTTEDQQEEEILEQDRGDYIIDEKSRQAYLTEQGHQKVEELMLKMGLLAEGDSLYDMNNITLMHYITAALRAHALYRRDVDYVVKNDQIIIVDEHTGRLMEGRRWSDGLHQAVEAREGVAIQLENQTLASITLQNYFRLYEKLSGMTGTADTEAFEFQKIYGLEVVVIPTNRAMVRKDYGDQIYLGQNQKFKAIIADIKKCYESKQPVLVGTASIENSEKLSALLQKAKIPHQVLNAKQHEREAKIIAQAGRPGSITIATNMAGRGTDIVLGGNLEAELAELEDATPEKIEHHKTQWKIRHDQVIQAGGLYVLGTERHESRRIDNQLRGRSGRQGDPGSSRFYLSMEDNLLRIFAADRMTQLMRTLGIKEDEVIEHPMISRAIERAQRRVEGLNFDIRKQLLEYDDVANDQRKVIYQQRKEILLANDISDTIRSIREESVEEMINLHIPPNSLEEQWDILGLEEQLAEDFALKLNLKNWLEQDENLHEETLREKIYSEIENAYQQKVAKYDLSFILEMEKSVLLSTLDMLWREHLSAMDHLRRGIHLRGYAQRNPAQEFKRESFDMFTRLLTSIKYETIATLSRIELTADEKILSRTESAEDQLQYQHASVTNMLTQESIATDEQEGQSPTFVRSQPKVGRNDPCPCGSGKKYKQCHGKIEV